MAIAAKTRSKAGVKSSKPKAKPRAKTAKKPEKKKEAPKATKKAIKERPLQLPDNSAIDLAAYDWGGEKLTDTQKLFIIWFSTPGTEYYHRVLRAAKKAGYSLKTASVTAYKLRNEPRIDKLIRQFEEKIGSKVNIVDAAQRWLQEKIVRGDFRIGDFYKTVEYKDKLGRPKQTILLKPVQELTDEQQLCVDGLDVKGMQGTMVYSLPDREKVRDSLINFVQKSQGGDDDDYDIETVAEIIKGNTQVKMKVITKNREIMARADGFVDAPRRIIEEE